MTEDVRFYFRFIEVPDSSTISGQGTPNYIDVEIAEPIGFDAANFVLEQRDKGLARDVSFASGSADLKFSPLVNFRGLTHQFDRLIDEYKTNGFEADVKLVIKIDGDIYVIGQLDFAEAETDLTTFFKCKIIQENIESLIKRRSKVKVDLFSNKDLDGNIIDPIEPKPIYLTPTPFVQNSKWTMPFSNYGLEVTDFVFGATNRFFNPFVAIEKTGIENTLSPAPTASSSQLTDFKIIEAQNTITDGVLTISDFGYRFVFRPSNHFPYAEGSLWYYIGNDFQYGDATRIFSTGVLSSSRPSYYLGNYTFKIEDLTIRRGEYLMLFFQINVQDENQMYKFENYVTSGEVTFEGVSKSVPSSVQSVSFYDAAKQVVKSISGLDIQAPDFWKTQYIADGLRIRNIVDEPFNISLDDITGHLTEWRADFEVTGDKVFFGLFKDFYSNKKVGSFDMLPNEEFKSSFNDEYKVNTLEMKYSSFSNDNDEDGSRDAVHCQLQMMFQNKMVENNKQINIKFIRDSFLIESTRKKAVNVNDSVAAINDNDVFIVDTIEKIIQFDEILVLRHLVDENGDLKLLNDGTFNWKYVGLEVGGAGLQLEISNEGFYNVARIESTVLTLRRVGIEPTQTGELLTRVTFFVDTTNIINRTNEGFNIIYGIQPEGISNLAYTPKRNLLNFWNQYLATANTYTSGSEVKMTDFKNNPKLNVDGIVEGDNITHTVTPTLKPTIINTQVLCTFQDFWILRENVRNHRGYIEISTNEGDKVNVYPKILDFEWESNLLTIKGEVKNHVSLSEQL